MKDIIDLPKENKIFKVYLQIFLSCSGEEKKKTMTESLHKTKGIGAIITRIQPN